MSAFEWNKVIGAVLVALLVIKVADIVGEAAVHPEQLAENAYPAPGIEQAKKAGTAEAPAPRGPEVEPVAPLLADASVEEGKKVARKCTVCHSLEKGAAPKIGPNLWGIVGAKKAGESGFRYSSAFQKLEGEWTYEALNKFLHDPKGYAPGTRMAFAGLKKASERAAVIKYLRSLSDNPPPLP